MFDLYLSVEQEKREKQELEQVEFSINRSSSPVTEQYSGGWFDGLIGETPRYPELGDYWSGYQKGLREYYATLAGIELPNDC